jgi:hypothetical protein
VRSARKLPNARRVFSQRVLDEFGQSGFGAVRCPGVGNRRDLMKKNKARRFGKSVFFFSRERTEQKRYS